MTAVRSASEEVVRLIEVRRARAEHNRRQAAQLVQRAQRDDAEADALATMLQAAGMGQEPTVHFDDPRVK